MRERERESFISRCYHPQYSFFFEIHSTHSFHKTHTHHPFCREQLTTLFQRLELLLHIKFYPDSRYIVWKCVCVCVCVCVCDSVYMCVYVCVEICQSIALVLVKEQSYLQICYLSSILTILSSLSLSLSGAFCTTSLCSTQKQLHRNTGQQPYACSLFHCFLSFLLLLILFFLLPL